MRILPSCCISLQSPDPDRAYAFYQRVIGLQARDTPGEMELEAPPLRLFCDKGSPDVIFELLVDHAETVRDHLVANGCTVTDWQGQGKHYVADPHGFQWNVYEDPQASEAPGSDQRPVIGKYRFSNCFALGVPDRNDAVALYRDVFGFKQGKDGDDWTEVEAGPLRLFICDGGEVGPIGSIDVRDRDAAHAEFEAAGCVVVRWEPEKGCCFMRNPHGFVFDVHEDSEAFTDEPVGGNPSLQVH